jgi:hypothetical protein
MAIFMGVRQSRRKNKAISPPFFVGLMTAMCHRWRVVAQPICHTIEM